MHALGANGSDWVEGEVKMNESKGEEVYLEIGGGKNVELIESRYSVDCGRNRRGKSKQGIGSDGNTKS